jgi:leucyl aminopeptidase
MRGSILTALLLASAVPASARPVYISLGADGVRTAFEVASTDHAQLSVERMNTPVAVLRIDDRELEPLSALMHERFHRCGGFLVHESLADALAEPPPARPPIEYTIDRGDVVRAVLPAIRERDILSTIRALSSRKNRYYRSESGADASRWLAHRWMALTGRGDVTVSTFDQGYPQKSVMLTIRGTTRPEEVVVIGGHLDSIAPGGIASDAPGADDDASGIATLDHIAQTLLTAGYRPERTVQFIAYAAEEVGLRGSQAIARHYQRSGINVVGVLQLDMTNYQGSDRDIWLIDDFTSPAQNRFVADLIERYTQATWGVDRCGYACSDHASWHRIGVPASMPHETRSRDRNKNIHSARDTLEVSNNNAAHAAKFAQLGAAYAIELGKGTLDHEARARQAWAMAAQAGRDAAPDDHTGWKLAALLLAIAALAAARFSDPSRS